MRFLSQYFVKLFQETIAKNTLNQEKLRNEFCYQKIRREIYKC